MKVNYNYHSHTKRCGHACGEDEEYVLNAIRGGYKFLGFSDHAPYKISKKNERMDLEELDGYIKSVTYLKEKYKDQISIYLGLEIENYPSQREDIIRYRKIMDYCILGQHQLEIDGDSSYAFTSEKQLIAYAKRIEEACDLNLVDIIAHPDLFMYGYQKWDEGCVKAAKIICEASNRNKVPLEVNCGGYKFGKRLYLDGERYAYPTINFFKIAKDMGCEFVIGQDIHNPKYYIDESHKNGALAIIKDLNLNILKEYDIYSKAKERKRNFK